ncbi:MAG: RnfABCDGE type electron transport complex subunit D, partial [Bdellovibrionales bacterium]|nr:RnfABCDGE type electron transport complex subunit D [Bdellovibrionales bacterium]
MHIFEIVRSLIWRIEPKWFLVANHSTLLIYGLYSSCLQRTPLQIALAFGIGLPLELAIERLKKGANWHPWDQTKSAIVIILGLLIFLISRHWWFYGVAAVVALVSKSILLRPDGRHIYNPTGITILAMVAFFPNYVFVRGDQFNGTLLPFFSLLFFGSLATTRANRWRATASYLVASLITTLVITSTSPSYEFIRLFGPDFGAEGLLFMLLMFTDPRTSPNKPVGQIAYGIILGILNISFRSAELAYSQFLALFMVSSFLMPLIDWGYENPGRMRVLARKLSWTPSAAAQTWIKRIFIGSIIVSMPLAWLTKTESWPWSHYPMFASSRKIATTFVLRPA